LCPDQKIGQQPLEKIIVLQVPAGQARFRMLGKELTDGAHCLLGSTFVGREILASDVRDELVLVRLLQDQGSFLPLRARAELPRPHE